MDDLSAGDPGDICRSLSRGAQLQGLSIKATCITYWTFSKYFLIIIISLTIHFDAKLTSLYLVQGEGCVALLARVQNSYSY